MNTTKSQCARIRRIVHKDFNLYAPNLLKITTKGDTGQEGLVYLRLNKVQKFLHEKFEKQLKEKGRVRTIILKGRQFGCSTLIGGRYYWKTTHNPGKQAFVISHCGDTTDILFGMVKRFHENIPPLFRVSTDKENAKELNFNKIDSRFRVGTAGSKNVGRGGTIHYMHGSEVASWENASELVAGLFQCIPDAPGSEAIFESTSNGPNNFFHSFWQQAIKGEIEYEPMFISWAMFEEYSRQAPIGFSKSAEECELAELYGLTNDQLYWRRKKIEQFSIAGKDGLVFFKHEYPLCIQDAFQAKDSLTFIKSEYVTRARMSKTEGYGPLLIGVDPATGAGKDRSSIIKRQGRKAFDLESYTNVDTRELADKIHKIIEKCKPDKVFVDFTGVGVGVVDNLRHMGHRDIVVPVNAGSKSLDPERYPNKRHEMWGKMKDWLIDENEQVSIPDLESLHNDLCSVKFEGIGSDSNGRVLLQSKDKMHKSPDEADALALTFALPVSSRSNVNTRTFMNPTLRLRT
jgi:hypothetical protein